MSKNCWEVILSKHNVGNNTFSKIHYIKYYLISFNMSFNIPMGNLFVFNLELILSYTSSILDCGLLNVPYQNRTNE